MIQDMARTAADARRDRTAAAVKVDNLLRRRLRISDPGDPTEVAGALRRLYPADDRALEREASGLPMVLQAPNLRPLPAAGPSSVEVEAAEADVEQDLRFLATSPQLKDIDAELEGWGQAVRGHMAEGLASARQALDPRARDRTMAARRALGDYARAARLVGAMTPGFSLPYRRLAQNLDQVAGLMLVLMGEAMAQLGQGGGRFLLTAPASELIARRDAALNALRNLLASTQVSLAQDAWPWGLRGFGEVTRQLGDAAQADVRTLLEENALARLMDELIERASNGTGRGMRGLAATGQLAVQRLERLVQVAAGINTRPGSPPLAAFLEAVQLFADGFRGGGGAARLLAIARPPIVLFGLSDFGGVDDATRRLQKVIVGRGELARLLDCYMGCDCCGGELVCQVLLDKLLYDIDRAIDFYALGTDPNGAGEPEIRAAAFGMLIRQFLRDAENEELGLNCARNCLAPWSPAPGLTSVVGVLTSVANELEVPLLNTRKVVPKPLPGDKAKPVRQELCLQRGADERWTQLLAALTPGCADLKEVMAQLADLVDRTLERVDEGRPCEPVRVHVPATLEETFDVSPEAFAKALTAEVARRNGSKP